MVRGLLQGWIQLVIPVEAWIPFDRSELAFFVILEADIPFQWVKMMFVCFLNGAIIKECGCKLFCNFLGGFPAALKLESNMRSHWRKILVPMTKEEAPMTSGWCLNYQKHNCCREADSEDTECMLKLTMTIPNVQFSLVNVNMLNGMDSIVGCSASLKMSLSFFHPW